MSSLLCLVWLFCLVEIAACCSSVCHAPNNESFVACAEEHCPEASSCCIFVDTSTVYLVNEVVFSSGTWSIDIPVERPRKPIISGDSIRVLAGVSVTVKKLRFDGIGSPASTYGAIVVDKGGQFEAINSVFIDNTCRLSGGAIYSDGDVSVVNCDFTHNRAGDGGAISMNGDGLLLVKDCKFVSNVAIIGGAIVIRGSGSLISSPLFDSNIADQYAAVYIHPQYSASHELGPNVTFWCNHNNDENQVNVVYAYNAILVSPISRIKYRHCPTQEIDTSAPTSNSEEVPLSGFGGVLGLYCAVFSCVIVSVLRNVRILTIRVYKVLSKILHI